MRRLEVLALLAAATFTLQAVAEDKVVRLSDPVEVTDTAEIFGQAFTLEGEPMMLGALVEAADEHEGKATLVKARVAQVCQKKGCFFIAKDGDTVVRVSFKDYGFFVPTDISGKDVTFEASLKRVELSEEKAAHYRDDAKGAPVTAEPAWELVADAVSVPKA